MNQRLSFLRGENFLWGALLLSLCAHAVILFVQFTQTPSKTLPKPLTQRLEVTLVNAPPSVRPDNAPVVAQIDSDGGGQSEQPLRRTSPLPPIQQNIKRPPTPAKTPAEQLREVIAENEIIYSRLKEQWAVSIPPEDQVRAQKAAPNNTIPTKGLVTEIPPVFSELEQRVQEFQQRPKKTILTPRSVKAEYALYYKLVQSKIERLGTLNFPQKDGQKLYGTLVMYIPIFEDGTIYEKEGGVQVKISSGNKLLDQAAVRIVRMAAPFLGIPDNLRQKQLSPGGEVWELISTFRFTNQDILTTQIQ